jgi:hypothetical protein
MTIQMMNFFLQMAFGDSNQSYDSCNLVLHKDLLDQVIPLQGACQGNWGGPAMFVAITMSLSR